MARADNRDYLDGKMTATINWPLVAAIYPNLPFNTDGLIVANQPWSGAYTVGKQLWVTAQTTQFTAPGWTYLDSASGYLRAAAADGSYVTLEVAQRHRLELDHRDDGRHRGADGHLQRHRRPVHRRRARVEHERQLGQPVDLVRALGRHHADQRQLLAHAPARLRLLADHHDRPGQGHRGEPGAGHADAAVHRQLRQRHRRPAAAATCPSSRARSRSRPCAGGRSGQCLQQQAAMQPIEWDNNANPYTIGGNLSWANYTVSADALIQQAGAVQLLGPGRHADGLLPGGHQRLLLPGRQHRRLVDLPQQHQRHDHHAGQRHRRGARHRHLAPPGADPERLARSAARSTARPSARSPTPRSQAAWSASGSTATRPTSSTTCRVTPLGSATPTGPIIAGDNTAKCVDDNGAPAPTAPTSRCGTATAPPRRTGR